MKKYCLLLLFLTFLPACQPDQGAIPTHEEVAYRYENPTSSQLLAHCQKKGGHYEDWKNADGSFTTYCILPQGYGCDPKAFFQGTCSVEEL